MVAVIKSGYSIHRILNYNENKVNEGVAQCIGAGNYPLDPEYMSFTTKLNLLRDRLELSHRAKRTSVHVSLNFDPSEKSLSTEKLMQIADQYMVKIGFGNQPYLVYQHHDAGHPHIHIVSINIKPDGTQIDMNLIGKKLSEPARKSLEKEHGLVRAEDHSERIAYRPEPINISTVEYGKLETKKAIQNVLEYVLTKYSYTSLPELNALLGRYNIAAQVGQEGSRVKSHNGLLYRVLDSSGNPIGIPIKASAFYNRPTLVKLQKYFDKGAEKRTRFRARLRSTVDLVLNDSKTTLTGFVEQLSAKGIDVVFRKNEYGYIYGVTYVDHVSKSVFNGSLLGKNYSAKAIQERCGFIAPIPSTEVPKIHESVGKVNTDRTDKVSYSYVPQLTGKHTPKSFMAELIDLMTKAEYMSSYIPYEFRIGKKKKRKKRK